MIDLTGPDLIPNVFERGSLNLFAGAPAVGKTTLIAGMAVRFRDGLPVFGYPVTPPTSIGYLSSDRSWRSSGKWFTAAGFPEMRHYSIIDDASLKRGALRVKTNRLDLFERGLDTLNLTPGGLIIADPVALFLGGNLLDYDIVASACTDMQKLLDDRDLILIGACHASKQKGDKKDRYGRFTDRISGSNALAGYTWTMMYLADPEETESGKCEFHWLPHHAPGASYGLERGPNGLFRWDDSLTQLSGPPTLGKPVVQSGDPAPPIRLTDELLSLASELTTTPISTHALVTRYADTPRATLFRRLRALADGKWLWNPERGQWARTEKPLSDRENTPTYVVDPSFS